MPQALPSHVFVRHLVIHTVKNLAIWLRFCLVVVVWVCLLPWAMRHVWGFLFWFGDGGWNSKITLTGYPMWNTSKAIDAIKQQANILMAHGTSPAHPMMTRPTTPASVVALLQRIPGLPIPMAYALNFNATEVLGLSS